MNAAAGSMAVASVGAMPQQGADAAATDDESGADFTAALANAEAPAPGATAATVAPAPAFTSTEPVPAAPDATQSDAALAWMAGMLNDMRLPEPPPPVADGDVDNAVTTSLTDGALIAATTGAAVAVPKASAASIDAPVGVPKVSGASTGAAVRGQPHTGTEIVAATADTEVAAADPMALMTRLLASFPERTPAHAASEVEFDPLQPASGNALYTQTREAVTAPAAAAQTSFADTLRNVVGSPRWGDELGSRLVTMSTRGQQEGSLTLSPEHLGPVEVRITVSEDGTNVWFGAQHADTRTALTDALPRLRELFAASGLALGQAGVSQEMPRQEARRSELASARLASGAVSDEIAKPASMAHRVRSALVDTWA